MDEPIEQTKVHLTNNYSRVIKDIENLEQFYNAKVLAKAQKTYLRLQYTSDQNQQSPK